MSDRDYHEVQLSGKQLVFLFISAVVLAVVIFLLGVAVGRGVPTPGTDVPVSADIGAAPAPIPATDDAEPPAAAQELSYHDLLAGTAGAAASATPEAPTPTPAAEPVTTPPPPPPAPAETGAWLLQIGAYSTREAADRQVAALKRLDVPVFVLVPGTGTPDRFFRVRVGPYGTEAEAEQVRARLVREGFAPQVVR
jgi:DedD protein